MQCPPDAVAPSKANSSLKKMVWIPGGTFNMGSNAHYPEESPTHVETVNGFWMDQFTVTNLDFGSFIEATGYTTVAERTPDPALYPGAKSEMLAPGSVVFRQPLREVDLTNHFNWWQW